MSSEMGIGHVGLGDPGISAIGDQCILLCDGGVIDHKVPKTPLHPSW